MAASKLLTRFRKKILTIVLYCLGLFLFFEMMARLAFSIIIVPLNTENSLLQRIGWSNRHYKQKKASNYSEEYSFDIYDLMKGWALKPNIHNMVVFDGKILNSNSKGIRGKNEYYKKNPNKLRILVIGDSFTFGEGVSDNETYSYYLQQMLPGTEVINFGIHGYGHDQMLIYLKEEGIKYNPDIVILGYLYGDNIRNMLDFYYYAKPKFELENGKLKLTNSPVLPPKSILQKEFYRLKIFDTIVALNQEILRISGVTQKNMEKLTEAILDEMFKTIKSINAVPIFVYLPVESELININDKFTRREYFLSRFCEKRNIPCLLLRHYFINKTKDGVKFKSAGHWEPQEHLIAAQGINEFLLDNNLTNQKQEK